MKKILEVLQRKDFIYGLKKLYESGYLQSRIPEFENFHLLIENPKYHPEGNTWDHTLGVVERIEFPELRIVALMHDIGKAVCGKPSIYGDWNSFHNHNMEGEKIIGRLAGELEMSDHLVDQLKICTRHHMQVLYTPKGGWKPISCLKFQDKVGRHLNALYYLCTADAYTQDRPKGWQVLFNEVWTAERTLRKLLWLKHGHQESLYGDDGEMQCSKCRLDFKRDSVEAIEARFDEMNSQALIKFMEDKKNSGD